jgi:hypothetical protein
MTTEDVAACENYLRAAQVEEQRAASAATAALEQALEAKCKSIHAWIRLAQARGSTEDFKSVYQETVILTSRRMRSCEKIVSRALHVGLMARLGLETSN